MTETLIEAYGESRLPRYTSYPTAPAFSPETGASDYLSWLRQVPAGSRTSLYVHIPFCRSMCWYCGCHTTITERDQPVRDYLDVLRAEIAMTSAVRPDALVIDDLHFGGGTPTIMEPQDFLQLMAHLRHHFDFHAGTAIAIEIDPRRLTAEMAMALGEGGVGRASVGVQSFDPRVQKAINRIQSFEETWAAVRNLYRAGIQDINFDLIYGLPHQTVRSCVETVHQAIMMRPSRFSVFGYAHVPAFKKHQRLIDEGALPGTRERLEQSEAIAERLVAAGYQQIGLDHFALPFDPLAIAARTGKLHRNFQGYTTDACQTLIGLGASSIGHFEQGFIQNDVAPGGYARAISAGRFASVKGYRTSGEDRLRGRIIERLMCDFEADLQALCAGSGFDAHELLSDNLALKDMEDGGLVSISGGKVRLEHPQRFLIRAVASTFDAYLAASGRTHSKAA